MYCMDSGVLCNTEALVGVVLVSLKHFGGNVADREIEEGTD